MKKSKIIILLSFLLCGAIFLSACAAYNPKERDIDYGYGNTYTEINEDGFTEVSDTNNKSYISLTTSTASYSDIRRQILNRQNIDKDSVKIEEMINYFRYDYPAPETDKPLSMSGTVMNTPWNNDSKLLMVGMKAEDVAEQERTNNIVLLVDVSGSMYGADRLGLAVQGLIMLVNQMNSTDIISLVTYAGRVSVMLDGVSGENKEEIIGALLSLQASGSTAGGSAINKAYDIASKYQDSYDNSSIIIITDGDFNVGISSPTALKEEIIRYKGLGISLSAAGVGFGNMRSDMLETIADAGGGRHAYLANSVDAKKFLVEELGAMLNVVAMDAKAEIAFNPDVISQYRIIGYENRQLTEDEWKDEGTNAGAIGSGTMVTAIYEIKCKPFVGIAKMPVQASIFAPKITLTGNSGDYATLTVKYKTPDTNESRIDNLSITESHDQNFGTELDTKISREDSVFIASVAEIGLLLRNSAYKGTASYTSVFERLSELECTKSDKYKEDFLNLIDILKKRY